MFFMKFWAKALDYLPVPTDSQYRQIEPFKIVREEEVPDLANLVDIKQMLLKVKVLLQISIVE